MDFVAAISCFVGLGLVWWIIYRLAMRNPNNGNEFSRDDRNQYS
jgi:hypothetical protein